MFDTRVMKLYERFFGFEDEENRALKYAKRKHDDTKIKRKASGLPYFVHPYGASQIAKAYGAAKEVVIACACHDLLEDAGVTIEDIEEKFGSVVAEIVSEVTNDGVDMAKYADKEDYLNQKLRFMSSPAFTVKLSDNLSNLVDRPSVKQAQRIRKNVAYAARHRSLDSVQKSLIAAIL